MACICLYGAASDRIQEDYIETVEELGRQIAGHGHSMIYGAGASGLMGAAARGMTEAGGYIIGVTPHFMHEFEPIYECTEVIDTETMAERKVIMESRADAFIVVPGGIGTFDEFFQILTLKELDRLGNKPIILLNVEGYYNELYAMMQAANAKGFFREKVMKLFSICSTPEEAMAELDAQLAAK
ncbi:MAG: TIGR00730 family Rossman fold protein [Eubacteriales bacterium]|nr:TIGR00730 family Rossman fold protein [Eubacteriales bacterium]